MVNGVIILQKLRKIYKKFCKQINNYNNKIELIQEKMMGLFLCDILIGGFF